MPRSIKTDQAPTPIGPYNQAMKCGDMVFVSGQVAINPESGEMVQTDIEAETNMVMQNLKAVVEASGLNMDAIVKCTIFVTDMNDFATVNKVYGGYFLKSYPARETVEVSALPAGARVEISCIATK